MSFFSHVLNPRVIKLVNLYDSYDRLRFVWTSALKSISWDTLYVRCQVSHAGKDWPIVDSFILGSDTTNKIVVISRYPMVTVHRCPPSISQSGNVILICVIFYLLKLWTYNQCFCTISDIRKCHL